jgi:phosphopantetheinyl transferase (holo-ACP synthase)
MTRCRRVAQDVWLALAARAPEVVAIERERRWAADREAADRAVAAVLEASGLGRDACATSRSHTCGLAVAVAAPAGITVGVDLVEVARVSRRHAHAILSSEEWEALEQDAAERPALGWALKEAAAKACGDPSRCFPLGLRIIAGVHGYTVEALGSGAPRFTAGWGRFDGFLYAWVRGGPAARLFTLF